MNIKEKVHNLHPLLLSTSHRIKKNPYRIHDNQIIGNLELKVLWRETELETKHAVNYIHYAESQG